MSDKIIPIKPSAVSVAINPETKNVGILFGAPDEELGLAPGVKLALELTPQQAIDLASVLLKQARTSIDQQFRH